jgi:hypothetical protein
MATARKTAAAILRGAGRDIENDMPDFELTYADLQKRCQGALNIPRIQMPVIEPSDIEDFEQRLKDGRIDIFKPWARGRLFFPTRITPSSGGQEWVNLGFADGDIRDDVVAARITRIAADKLKPTQSQIWLNHLVKDMAKWGNPHSWSGATERIIIVSKEGYILDGHHRWARVILTDASQKMRVLRVPLTIDILLKVGRSYGAAVGNTGKA